jgi:hypothetical protein
MTARPRPAPEGAGTTSAVSASAPRTHEQEGAVPPAHWEEWFQNASPGQRAAALAVAQQQGQVNLHQLPALNGQRALPTEETPAALALAALFAGRVEQLPAYTAAWLEPLDPNLDEVQRLAVARALATPDLCLVQGLPGAGKSRVVAEIIAQAARAGRRVLLVAVEAPPLDVVLQRLVGQENVLALRLLDAAEQLERLPAWLHGFTLAEQQRVFLAQSLAGARRNVREAEESCERRVREQECWPALRALAQRADLLRQSLVELRVQHDQVAETVAREAEGLPCMGKGIPSGPFTAEFLALTRAHAESLQALDTDQTTLLEKKSARTRERDDLERQCAQSEPAYQAKMRRRWWTAAFWRATWRGDVVAIRGALRERLLQANAALSDTDVELAELERRRGQLAERARHERAALCRDETLRRQQELRGRQETLAQELDQLCVQGREHASVLAEIAFRPAELGPSAVEQVHTRWQQRQADEERSLQFARQWLNYLEEAGPQFAHRLPELANVLVATSATLAHEPSFRAALGIGFDLLIVEEAERLTEAELLRLAGYAHRLVLVGQPLADAREPITASRIRSLSGLQPLAPACWPRLWQALGGELGRLPYLWHREEDRLVCQLVPLSAEDRQHLESEGLADAADVELRILNRPKGRPSLAQVAFPAEYSLQEAFALIVRELAETPLPPAGRTTWWHEDSAGLTWCAGPAAAAYEYVAVEPGLRIAFRADADVPCWRAARVEFTRAAGWDQRRAEDWFAQFSNGHDSRRTVFLQLPYRFARPLAQAVSTVLFPDDSLWPLLPPLSTVEPHLEFVAVPALRKPELPREGAGLELDLTATRHADRLPAELRPGLPLEGFVNYLEAQALVRRLEQLAQTPGALPASRCGQPEVAVLALFEGQAELLRRLLAKSEVLREMAPHLEVGVPAQFRQRECAIVLLSLTRSHPHRSVPFGADVADLGIALTRARHKLYVFGDPGALVKRIHWQGPLDHLPASAAHLEWLRLSRLVSYIHDLVCPSERLLAHQNGR